ncbi:mechanosensitive cation channel TMEM63A-like isoform X2 [Dermatophagoides pteronyssinus]
MTLIEIDRGWEGIPESLVIQLILCLFLILPFVIFRYLARYHSYEVKNNNRTNWIQFIYGNRDFKKKKIVHANENFQSIQSYFNEQNILPAILPYHLSMCKNQKKINQRNLQSHQQHRRTHSTTYGSSSSTIVNNITSQPSSSSISALTTILAQNNQQDNNSSPSSSSSSSSSSTTSTVTTNTIINATKHQKTNSNGDNNIFASNTAADLSGSKSNLVPTESTFPIEQNSNVQTVFINLSNNPINYIQRLFSHLLNITDEDILKNKGHDAYQYLLFQRYIIIFLFILSFVTIVIILPINVQGNNEGKAFARTSISNVPHDSNLYWAHAICSTFIIIVGVFLMNRFSSELKTDDDLMFCKTLLIRRIPILDNLVEKLKIYFDEKFPDVKISGIQLIADVRELDSLEQSYQNAVNALKYCEEINNELRLQQQQQQPEENSNIQQQQQGVVIILENNVNDKRFMIRPINCNRLFGCCICCCHRNNVDAAEFYRNEKQELEIEIYDELRNIPKQSVRSAFITFQTELMAMKVYKYIKNKQKHSCANCLLFGLCLNFRNEFDLAKCLVSHAPFPDDVNWRDIAFDMNLLWLRKMAISIILFIIFFFLSTPAFLLKIFDLIATKELIKQGILKPNSIIADFMSPFLLMLLAVILPSIVTFACQMIPYKTISNLNHAVMSKVYAFLVMMIIVLPSTGFLSINAMLGAVLASNTDQHKFRWHCLFPVDNGAFFVIYALQAAILGNVAEILRIPELVLYLVYSLFLRSPAEYQKARKWVTFDFPFGVSYPRFLLIFTMTVIYSFACPLIAPCGLLYMIGKHIVDRYNIYHVYQPTKINRRIHSSAIMYVHIGLILMQFQLFTVMIIKTQYSRITLFILIVLIITLLAFTFFGFQHWFRNLITSRINNRNYKQKRDFCVCSYTPPVLYHLLDDGLFQQSSTSQSQTQQ